MTAAVKPARRRPVAFRSHVELILDRAIAQPDRVMLSDATTAVTGAQFDRGVRNAAGLLMARGVRPGMVVALAAPVCIEAVLVRYAAGLMGCATVVCPNAADPDRLRRFLAATAADALVCFPASPAAAHTGPAGRIIVITAVELDREPRVPTQHVGPDQLAILVTSGGTTGDAKASVRTFADWRNALAMPPTPTRRQLICTPLAYIAQILLDQTLLGGGTVVLRDHFDPALVLRTIETERITHLCLVEPRLVELADHRDVVLRDLSSLVAISHIGADAAPSLRRRLLGQLGPCLAHPYGASEAGLVSVLGPDQYDCLAGDLLGSAGRILPGVEVRIEETTGESGRIVVRSTGVARGYAGGVDHSAFRPDGWFDTGDCGYLDAGGFLHVRGRAKDERSPDGVSTFPVDVQDALCAQPGVAYAVALAGDDGFDAVVQLLPGFDPTADTLRARLPHHLGLRRLLVLDRIPVTEQGKPDRLAIRARLDA
jgi:fatty-acyl-CoA synthase